MDHSGTGGEEAVEEVAAGWRVCSSEGTRAVLLCEHPDPDGKT